ncbi:serine protease, partial [Bacillus altitudinis]|nr:serine protease [Bacillus altitudinis]
EVYAQLVRRTLPLKQSKTLVGNGFLYLTAPDVLLEKTLEAELLSL